ncbi:hypothetical protein FBUS_01396 [Fasciolopsis buskii]|uniref:SCP2 domain-containing protein n=1 Tax=Fasciolopsis buskii TaxID=27845 RepID=A0A8E0RNH1_9TREM|nr:hypothetical protein FBUS_01396 [Fasciolopsis buski]
MVVSEAVSSEVSTKWFKGLVRSKQEHNDSSVHQPYIFSYEDPSVYAEYKPLYNLDPDTRKEDNSEPTDAQNFAESAFKYSDNVIGTTEFTTQYETIFTYAEPLAVDPVLTWTEEPNRKRKTALRLSVSYVFIGLSVLLLITIFPILCWICVKGQTRDEGEVEIHCEITYRINDPDLTYLSSKKSPSKIITTFAGTCITKALEHLTWSQLEEGGGKQDLANEIVVRQPVRKCLPLIGFSNYSLLFQLHSIVNVAFMDYKLFMQIVNPDAFRPVNAYLLHYTAAMTLTRAPPSPETLKRSKLSTVQKQLQSLSSLFFPGQNRSSAPKPDIHSKSDKSPTEENESVAPVAPSSVNPDVKGNTNADGEESVSRSRLLSLRVTDASATRAILCSQVIARAQPYLSNDLVCRALDRATLQLVIGSDRIGEPLPSLKETTADEAHYSVLYLDAKSDFTDCLCIPGDPSFKPMSFFFFPPAYTTGRATVGVLSDPDVTVFVNTTDLSEVLIGQLDLMKAVTSGQVKVQGNTKALDKLRHLLFLRAV